MFAISSNYQRYVQALIISIFTRFLIVLRYLLDFFQILALLFTSFSQTTQCFTMLLSPVQYTILVPGYRVLYTQLHGLYNVML